MQRFFLNLKNKWSIWFSIMSYFRCYI